MTTRKQVLYIIVLSSLRVREDISKTVKVPNENSLFEIYFWQEEGGGLEINQQGEKNVHFKSLPLPKVRLFIN